MSIDHHQFTFIIPLKPLREFINLLQDVFPPLILQDQDCFAGDAGAEELLALLPGGAQTEPLRKKWSANPHKTSEEKWDDIRNQVKVHGKTTTPGVSSLIGARGNDGDPILTFIETPLGRDGRYRPPIYLAPDRCRSLQASEPLTQGSVLCPPEDWAGLCACGSDKN